MPALSRLTLALLPSSRSQLTRLSKFLAKQTIPARVAPTLQITHQLAILGLLGLQSLQTATRCRIRQCWTPSLSQAMQAKAQRTTLYSTRTSRAEGRQGSTPTHPLGSPLLHPACIRAQVGLLPIPTSAPHVLVPLATTL